VQSGDDLLCDRRSLFVAPVLMTDKGRYHSR
jgi:hypothetical protein